MLRLSAKIAVMSFLNLTLIVQVKIDLSVLKELVLLLVSLDLIMEGRNKLPTLMQMMEIMLLHSINAMAITCKKKAREARRMNLATETAQYAKIRPMRVEMYLCVPLGATLAIAQILHRHT